MTVGSLPITMAPAGGGHSVATEFSWTTPFSCASKTPRGGVATSGFNLSTFVGKSNGPVISLTGRSCVSSTTSPTNPSAFIQLFTDGTSNGSDGGGGVATYANWATPTTTGIGSSYYVLATLNSGTLNSGTIGSWLALSTIRNWGNSRTTNGTTTANITLQISTTPSLAGLVASGSFTITSTRSL